MTARLFGRPMQARYTLTTAPRVAANTRRLTRGALGGRCADFRIRDARWQAKALEAWPLLLVAVQWGFHTSLGKTSGEADVLHHRDTWNA